MKNRYFEVETCFNTRTVAPEIMNTSNKHTHAQVHPHTTRKKEKR